MVDIVGSVGVTVVPDVQKWDAQLKAKLLPQADRIGTDIGNRIGRNAKQKIREQLSKLPDAKVGLDTKKADAQLDKFRKKAAKDIKTGVKVDSKGLADYAAKIKAATKTRTQKIKVETDTSVLDKIAGKLKGANAGGGLVASLAAVAPAVAGIGATAIPALGGLAAAMLTAGAGTAAFGAVAIPTFKDIQTNSKSLAKAQASLTKAQDALNVATTKAQRNAANKAIAKATQAQSAALAKMTPNMRKAVTGYNDFKTALKDFQKSEEPAVLPAIAGGFDLIAHNLPKIKPLVDGASSAFTTLEKDADKSLNAPFYKKFFDFLGKDGKQSIIDLGKAAGNTFTGIFGTIQGFSPEIAGARAGLVGITKDFAKFGEKAAAGQSKSFNEFVTFAKTDAPAAEQALKDIGSLTGNTLKGLGPSVKPSLNLISDIAKGLGPVIDPIEKKLPGVITSLDGMVKKLAPVAATLSKAFAGGAAATIESIASGVGKLADAANRLPSGVLSAVGSTLGALAVLKFTGLAKLAGYLLGIGAAEKTLGTGGGISGIGGQAATAEGKVGKLRGSLSKLGSFVMPAAVGLSIGNALGRTKPVQDLARSFEVVRKNAEQLPGPLGQTARAFNSVAGKASDLLGNTSKIGGQGTTDLKKYQVAWAYLANGKQITIQVKGQETVKKAFEDATRIAKGLPPLRTVTIKTQDGATKVIQGVKSKVDDLTHTPGVAHVTAQDKASATIAGVKAKIASIPKQETSDLKAKDAASAVAAGVKRAIGSVTGKTVTVKADVSGAGDVASLESQINALHNKEIAITTRVQTIQLQTLKTSSGRSVARAAGGPINGPGTSTSDSIPAMLSRGEYVVKASRVAKLGQAFMDRLNGGSGGPDAVGGYAAGGAVKKITEADYLSQRTPAPRKLTADQWAAVEQARKVNSANHAAAVKTAGLASVGQHAVSEIVGGMTGSSSIDSIKSAGAAVMEKITSSFKGKKESSLVTFVRRDNAAMSKLATARDKVIAKIQAAKDLSASVTASAKATANVTSLVPTSAKGIGVQLRAKLSNILKFNSNLKKVSKLGLSPEVIADIVAAGPDEGGAVLAQLAKGSKGQIASINSTQRQIDKASGALGKTAVNATLGGNAAKDFVSGLGKQRAALEKQMDSLASRFANTIGKAFGLKKVPARRKAAGGFISGPGSATSDSIPANLSNGEYVVRAQQVAKYGRSFFDSLNGGHGTADGNYAAGGPASAPAMQTIIIEMDGKVITKVVNDQNKRDVRVRVR